MPWRRMRMPPRRPGCVSTSIIDQGQHRTIVVKAPAEYKLGTFTNRKGARAPRDVRFEELLQLRGGLLRRLEDLRLVVMHGVLRLEERLVVLPEDGHGAVGRGDAE